jgi:lipoprotein-releasing system permease protein
MSRDSAVVRLLARKFMLSRSSDAFVSLIAWVSVAGVALGVLALTVVTSVINGFEGELKRVITGMNGDVVLYSRSEPFADLGRVESRIRQILPETQAISPSLVMELMVSGPGAVAGAVVEGLDWEKAMKVTQVHERVIAGRLPSQISPAGRLPEVALGEALATRIGAKLGDEVRLVIPFAGGDIDSGTSSKVVATQVAGIIKMGMYEYDSKFVFAALPVIQEILDATGKVTSIKLRLESGTDTHSAAIRLGEGFGYPFRAKDWGQLNRNLFYAIQLEKVVISIILTAIVLVAAFNVVSTLMMLMHDKSREIAILKAMGLAPAQGFRLFVWIGAGIGFVGAWVGGGLGLLVNQFIEKSRLIELPADIYYIGFLPVVTRWGEFVTILLVAFVLCLVATLYPAWRLARRSPLEGIRDA